jgi:hypothetical protein
MGCGCRKKKTPAELLARQKVAEDKRALLKARLDARRREVAEARKKR